MSTFYYTLVQMCMKENRYCQQYLGIFCHFSAKSAASSGQVHNFLDCVIIVIVLASSDLSRPQIGDSQRAHSLYCMADVGACCSHSVVLSLMSDVQYEVVHCCVERWHSFTLGSCHRVHVIGILRSEHGEPCRQYTPSAATQVVYISKHP